MARYCPGRENIELKARLIPCPNCHYEVEIFSDEMSRKCPQCKTLVKTDKIPSCVDWCPAAEECLKMYFGGDDENG